MIAMVWPSAAIVSIAVSLSARCCMFWLIGRWLPAMRGRSVRHAVEDDVEPDGVALGREAEEELRVLGLALPGIRDVGVVRHHHHQPAMRVADAAKVRLGAQLVAL